MTAGHGQGGGLSARGADRHVPVLLSEVLEGLAVSTDGRYIDATFGAGGYSRAILAAGGRVLALDRDPTAIEAGRDLEREAEGRLVLVEARFSELDRIAGEKGFVPADGVVLDIGVSSMQLDTPGRGFSFQRDGPLDMRMSATGPAAADVVNGAGEAELADILFELGEERRSRAIARAIVKARGEAPITTTLQLAEIVTRVLGPPRKDAVHPATRTFQALRIHVNDELGELSRALAAAERVLKPCGRLVVVSFHSLEDRIVKQFLVRRSGRAPAASRHLPRQAAAEAAPSFRLLNHRPIASSDDEIAANPRARSARLRAAERTEAPPVAEPAPGGRAGR